MVLRSALLLCLWLFFIFTCWVEKFIYEKGFKFAKIDSTQKTISKGEALCIV